MRNKQYYQLFVDSNNVAELHIFGDITAYPQNDTDVSLYNLSEALKGLGDVSQINVFINSYGGEVMEGLAIYNALKRHKAHVTTYCDGSACSIASVIFMAGDERVMCKPSFLMIHDAWTVASGNAAELRKQADDLETITTASVTAYMERVNITEEELRELMKAESWLTHDEALEMGFATTIEESSEVDKPSQSVKNRVFEMLSSCIAKQAEEDDDEEDDVEAPEKPSDAPDSDDEQEPGDDEESSEKGEKKAEGASDDDEPEQNDEKDKPDEAAQRWSGFFNAIFRV